MQRLSELVQITPRRNAGIALPCEIVAGHTINESQNYAEVKITRDVIVELPGGGNRPITTEIVLRCCSTCLGNFVYDCTAVHAAISK